MQQTKMKNHPRMRWMMNQKKTLMEMEEMEEMKINPQVDNLYEKIHWFPAKLLYIAAFPFTSIS
jgi:hypothetical protein